MKEVPALLSSPFNRPRHSIKSDRGVIFKRIIGDWLRPYRTATDKNEGPQPMASTDNANV